VASWEVRGAVAPAPCLVRVGRGVSESLSQADAARAHETGSDDDVRGTEPCVDLGLIVAPGLGEDVTQELLHELEGVLCERYPNIEWRTALVRDPLVTPPARLTDLVDATRDRMLLEEWDLAVLVTDLPLRLSHRPLLTHVSPTHGVALVSLPAFGVLQRRRRLRDAVADAVGALVGDDRHVQTKDPLARRLRTERRLSELASDIEGEATAQGVVFVPRVITGNIRLLLGMIGANNPWRLVGRLSRALLGALAAASFALVTSDVWQLSASGDALRLGVLTLGTIAAAVATLIVAHRLWERAPEPHAREQVALFNLATLATVAFGIVSLYLTVFVVSFAVAGVLIDNSLLGSVINHHHIDVWDYVRLAWLTSSLATVGGALGTTVETDASVREAAYAHRPAD
jgi:hypothetical protein